jgi:signal transduction histidine kinase
MASVKLAAEPTVDGIRSSGGDRVLVVGGLAATAAEGLTRILADQDCAVTVVGDTAAALEAMCGEAFLLVLVDPSSLGDSAARLLAHLQQLRRVEPAARIVILSDNPTLESAVEALRLGAFDYLQRPVSPAAVEALIRRARLEGDSHQRRLLLSLQALAPGLVHELRNPLSGILASGQMLDRLVAAGEPAREYLLILREEAQQLERLLARLAEFGRLRGTGLAPTDALDLHELLERLLQEARPTCRARRIRLAFHFDSRVPRLRGDPARLTLACAEILDNALEAMPDGGTLTVTTRLLPDGNCRLQIADCRFPQSAISHLQSEIPPEGGWVETEFGDTGTGMPAEMQRRAFEPFVSSRPRALGIGLSLAQAIALAHGGRIRLTSGPGRGTQVSLMLPATPTRSDDGSAKRTMQNGQCKTEN